MFKRFLSKSVLKQTASLGFFSRQSSAVYKQARAINHFKEYPQTFNCFNEKTHLSPLYGLAFHYAGLQNAYAMAEKAVTKTKTQELLCLLFHKDGEQFRTIRNKSEAAYYLPPKRLGEIIYNLNEGLLSDPAIIKTITDQWRQDFKQATNQRVTTKKVAYLLECIVLSKKECVAKHYPIYLTEFILLSFLHHRSESKQDLHDYIISLKQAGIDISLSKLYSAAHTSVQSSIPEIGASSALSADKYREMYEESILSIVQFLSNSLQEVKMGDYGYKNYPVKPDCVENAFHNLFNLLLFNNETKRFDPSLIPKANLCDELRAIYASVQFEQHASNSTAVGQQMMNFFSGKNFIYSCADEQYELECDFKNFLPVMNLAFSLNATSLDELGAHLSSPERQIQFLYCTSRVLKIIISQQNYAPIYAFFEVEPHYHTELVWTGFAEPHIEMLVEPVLLKYCDLNNDPLLFSLASSCEDLYNPRMSTSERIDYFNSWKTFFKMPPLNSLLFEEAHKIVNDLSISLQDPLLHDELKKQIAMMMLTNPRIFTMGAWIDDKTIITLGIDNQLNPDQALPFVRSVEVLQLLLDAGADIHSSGGKRLFHNALSMNNTKLSSFIENLTTELESSFTP